MKKNKLIYALLSLAISIFLWCYVVTVVSPETTVTFYNIPITITGEDVLREQNLTVSGGKDTTVTLRLTGKRSVINGQLDRDNITLTVDVSKIRTAGTYNRSYMISYPNSIQASSITVERKSPSTVDLTVEELSKKEIPIKTVFEGSVQDGYMLESIKPSFDTITLTGTQQQIQDISYAMVIVDQKDLKSSTTQSLEYTLMDDAGNPVERGDIEVDEETVNVTVSIVKHKMLPLTVEFTPGGGATEDNVTWKVSPATISVSGDETILEGLNRIVLGNIDLSTVVADTTAEFPIVLPDGVKNETGDVQATVTIALSGLSSTTIRVTNFEFINAPDGFVVSPMTQSLLVSVRGPEDEIAKLSSSNIRVVADLSGLSGVAGTYTCDNINIYLDGLPQSGVMGEYSVALTLLTQEDYLASLAESGNAGG